MEQFYPIFSEYSRFSSSPAQVIAEVLVLAAIGIDFRSIDSEFPIQVRQTPSGVKGPGEKLLTGSTLPGKESALFTPSGTFANQLALFTRVPRGGEVYHQ